MNTETLKLQLKYDREVRKSEPIVAEIENARDELWMFSVKLSDRSAEARRKQEIIANKAAREFNYCCACRHCLNECECPPVLAGAGR